MANETKNERPGKQAGRDIQARTGVARRKWLLLNAGIAAVGVLVLALLRQALAVDSGGADQVGAVLSALRGDGAVELLFFGAAASGYLYWCTQFLAGARPAGPRLARLANVAFYATVGMAFAALLLWNVALIAGPSAS
jgi:hypothetical protein